MNQRPNRLARVLQQKAINSINKVQAHYLEECVSVCVCGGGDAGGIYIDIELYCVLVRLLFS